MTQTCPDCGHWMQPGQQVCSLPGCVCFCYMAVRIDKARQPDRVGRHINKQPTLLELMKNHENL